MIGSIGAESRYSTGYNNLKPNRNQNKWADTLAQTVDKEDISSRADINRASMEEIHKFSTWQKVFDEIGGTYERVWSKEELDQGYLNN